MWTMKKVMMDMTGRLFAATWMVKKMMMVLEIVVMATMVRVLWRGEPQALKTTQERSLRTREMRRRRENRKLLHVITGRV